MLPPPLRVVLDANVLFPFTSGYEPLISAMSNDPKDRHVAAAAVHVQAHVIVTFNLSDFQDLPPGVEATSPDVAPKFAAAVRERTLHL